MRPSSWRDRSGGDRPRHRSPVSDGQQRRTAPPRRRRRAAGTVSRLERDGQQGAADQDHGDLDGRHAPGLCAASRSERDRREGDRDERGASGGAAPEAGHGACAWANPGLRRAQDEQRGRRRPAAPGPRSGSDHGQPAGRCWCRWRRWRRPSRDPSCGRPARCPCGALRLVLLRPGRSCRRRPSRRGRPCRRRWCRRDGRGRRRRRPSRAAGGCRRRRRRLLGVPALGPPAPIAPEMAERQSLYSSRSAGIFFRAAALVRVGVVAVDRAVLGAIAHDGARARPGRPPGNASATKGPARGDVSRDWS